MTELFDLARDVLSMAILMVVPLALAAVAGAVVAGLAAQLLGLQDQTVALVARAAGVVIALLIVADTMGERVRVVASDAWSGLAAVGRGDPPPR